MLEALADAGPRVGAGVATGLGLYLVGRLLAAGVRRRWLALDRPSFAHVMSRVVGMAFVLLAVLAAATIIFPTVKPVNVLGSVGFFSIAVGFAFRDILENLLAGILLLFRAPFRIGDEVEIEGTRGAVVEVNLRETVIRAYDGRRVLIPNATVYKNQLVVQTGYETIRTEAIIGVAYESDVEQARGIILAVLNGIEAVRAEPMPQVLVGELGASTVDMQILFWTAPQQSTVRCVRDQVLTEAKSALDKAGIEMPADIVVLQGTPSLKAAFRDDEAEATQAGGVHRLSDQTPAFSAAAGRQAGKPGMSR